MQARLTTRQSFVNPMNSLGKESTTYSYCTCFKLYTDDLNFSRGLIFAEKLIFELIVLSVCLLATLAAKT